MRVVVATRNTSGLPDFPGNVWVPLQYVAGLQRLGIEALWVDRQDAHDPRLAARECRTLPHRDAHSVEYVVRRFELIAREFGFAGRWCIVYDGGARHFGMGRAELEQAAAESDLLINIAGHIEPDSPLLRIPRRAYVDVDPGFTQMWSQQVDLGLGRHTDFFTVGQNVGRPSSRIPTSGVEWRQILPPVALDLWPASIDASCSRFSTIADWRGSQQVRFGGEYYGGKRSEFLRFLDVPQRAGVAVEIALCIGQHDHEDLGLLLKHGWCVREPYLYAGDLHSYREFIRFSRAELSVAKSGYVKAESGWMSDRTACYLASGKPAVVQSTGVEEHLPTGRGLLAFSTLDEALAAIEAVEGDYLNHCRAARRLAEEHFNSDLVLGSMLERAVA